MGKVIKIRQSGLKSIRSYCLQLFDDPIFYSGDHPFIFHFCPAEVLDVKNIDDLVPLG